MPVDAPWSQAGVVSGSNTGDPGSTHAPAATCTGPECAVGSGQVQQQSGGMKVDTVSSKWGREQEAEGDDYITANKTVKGQSLASESLPTGKHFSSPGRRRIG